MSCGPPESAASSTPIPRSAPASASSRAVSGSEVVCWTSVDPALHGREGTVRAEAHRAHLLVRQHDDEHRRRRRAPSPPPSRPQLEPIGLGGGASLRTAHQDGDVMPRGHQAVDDRSAHPAGPMNPIFILRRWRGQHLAVLGGAVEVGVDPLGDAPALRRTHPAPGVRGDLGHPEPIGVGVPADVAARSCDRWRGRRRRRRAARSGRGRSRCGSGSGGRRRGPCRRCSSRPRIRSWGTASKVPSSVHSAAAASPEPLSTAGPYWATSCMISTWSSRARTFAASVSTVARVVAR